VLVAERPGEHLRFAQVLSHARSIAERLERVPEIESDVDGQLGRLPGLGETVEGSHRLLQVGYRLAVGGPRAGPESRLAEIHDRLLPYLTPDGVMGQLFDVLGQPVLVCSLDRFQNCCVHGPALLW
jgi:hypothetical protein